VVGVRERVTVVGRVSRTARTEHVERGRAHDRVVRTQMPGQFARRPDHLDQFPEALRRGAAHLGITVTEGGQQRVPVSVRQVLHEGADGRSAHATVGVGEEFGQLGHRRRLHRQHGSDTR